MQRQAASPVHHETTANASRRLNARYEAHSALEADLMTLKMLRMDAEKSLNYRMSAASIGSPASTGSTGSSASYGSKGFDPILESTPAAAMVTERTIVCLRLFSEKESLASSSSKGMGTWEALYRSPTGVKTSDSSSLVAQKESKTTFSSSSLTPANINAARRILSFLDNIKSVQQGVLAPQVVIIAARQLLKFQDPESASLLVQTCMQDLISFYAGLKSDNRTSGSGTEGEEDPSAVARDQMLSQFRRAVQQGAFLPVEIAYDTHPEKVKERLSNELGALIALDVECAAQTGGVRKSLLHELTHHRAVQGVTSPLTEEEMMRCFRELLPSDMIEIITSVEEGCQLEKAQMKDWEMERATQLEHRKKVEALMRGIQAAAGAAKTTGTTQVASTDNSESTAHDDASQKYSKTAKQEGFLSSVMSFMQQNNGQGFPAKIILLVFVVLTVIGIVLRLGPSIISAIFSSGRAPRTKMLAL